MKLSEITLILHIGLHKTGTTYLQNSLSKNRKNLLQGNVLFPKTGFAQIVRDSGEVISPGHQAWVEHLEWQNRPELLIDLAQEIKSAEHQVNTVVISCENLTYAGYSNNLAQQAAKLFRNFGQIKIVAYLRQPDRWLESYYKELVTGSWNVEKRTFEQFCEEESEKLVDFYNVLKPWIDEFSAENIRLQRIEQFSKNDDLIADFLSLSNFSGKQLGDFSKIAKTGSYASPGRDVTELLRIFSTFIDFDDQFAPRILALRESLSKSSNNSSKTFISTELRKKILRDSEKPLQSLSNLFFSGDELYPSSAGATDWTANPEFTPVQIELLCEAIQNVCMESSKETTDHKDHERWLFALPVNPSPDD